ncbi:hypothetical protein L6452_13756 [Arctium lappa]|uniref:Uncharacterized protein n=1 Tax=Arctium lappa TaxID=4217 RepID=A0ACB9CJ79_ARCLA|nr:hypothetical protein L6452_13756 [Arctium lappa]
MDVTAIDANADSSSKSSEKSPPEVTSIPLVDHDKSKITFYFGKDNQPRNGNHHSSPMTNLALEKSTLEPSYFTKEKTNPITKEKDDKPFEDLILPVNLVGDKNKKDLGEVNVGNHSHSLEHRVNAKNSTFMANRIFRFENQWFQEEALTELVLGSWDFSTTHSLPDSLSTMADKLSYWGRNLNATQKA